MNGLPTEVAGCEVMEGRGWLKGARLRGSERRAKHLTPLLVGLGPLGREQCLALASCA